MIILKDELLSVPWSQHLIRTRDFHPELDRSGVQKCAHLGESLCTNVMLNTLGIYGGGF